ncbi:MAG: alpha/beta hydrolase [Paracoccus denitrificans]|uniref:Alpha/beta hydrolase n=1 Tax=Paracoccus denitrificans TaxID=266 RepID=A0A533I794_PARDE|nr:MAG: alpha/beta hydrolase [Paracoccus denitrificans]
MSLEKPETMVLHKEIALDDLKIRYREAGEPSRHALVLLHGYPSSSFCFRNLMPRIADTNHVLAPDMPGFGGSSAPSPNEFAYTFQRLAKVIESFLDAKGVETFDLYMHDWGVAFGYCLALARPDAVRRLIVQNGSAHEAGLGADWDTPRRYWKNPTAENRAALGIWMNREGVRSEYTSGLSQNLAQRVPPELWELDWARMQDENRKDIYFQLFCDYQSHIDRFPEITKFHASHQPPTLVLWGKRDTYFEIEEIAEYRKELDNVDVHEMDGGHFLLETHLAECPQAIRTFFDHYPI